MTPGADPGPGTSRADRGIDRHYLQLLLQGDVSGARALVESELQSGASLQELYLTVFQPALYEVGRLWQHGEVTVAQEHLATAATQTLMARLGQPVAVVPERERRRAIVTSSERDMHALGARFVADFLQAAGWTVIELGADTPAQDLCQLVAELRPQLVGLSTTLEANLPRALAAIDALSALEERPLIAAGGQAYGGDGSRALRMGADLFATDAGELMRALELNPSEGHS